jgi:hypothetical protein
VGVGSALASLIAVSACGGVAAADPASDADKTIAALRHEADQAAQAYFDALAHTRALDAQIADIETRLPTLEHRRRALRARARARAVAAYKRAGAALDAIISADDALNAVRRTHILERLNADDNAAFDDLARITERLQSQRRQLETARQAQRAALANLQASGRDIDAKLQAAENRRASLQAAAAATAAAARPVVPKGSGGAPPGPPPGYSPTPGTHPQHDNPFLVCTRTRESHGNYQAYNPAGPYMGAYQFLQSTWNSTANHAARPELIGVPPNTASEYDQDDMAWDLYQWQGSRPWGGYCG